MVSLRRLRSTPACSLALPTVGWLRARRSGVLIVVLLAVSACSSGDDGEAGPVGKVELRKAESVTVRLEVDEPIRAGAQVRWRVVVDNAGEARPVTYSSGQEAEVVLTGSAGEWRWSGNRMFTQGLREESLPAGETVYELVTEALDLPPGSYQAEARLATQQPYRSPARTIVVVSG